MRTSIHINHAPRVRTGNVEDKNALELRRFHDLKAWRVEERGSRRGLATNEWRVQIRSRSAVLIQRSCPRLERNVGSPRQTTEARTHFPIAFLVGRRSEVHMAVRPPRRRLHRSSIGL